jgi:small subunit ribosomal protein S8e
MIVARESAPTSNVNFIKSPLVPRSMVVIHGKSKRKPTGGRYTDSRTKRLHQIGSHPTHTKVAEQQPKTVRTKGGDYKVRLLAASKVNLFDASSKKHSVEEIKTVSENAADRQFSRRNIMTKGAIIMTSKGKAKITNRPGQEGVVNAVLVK